MKKEQCSFCGKPKDGTHKFISGKTGRLVCFDCVDELKKAWDSIKEMQKRPDDVMRVD